MADAKPLDTLTAPTTASQPDLAAQIVDVLRQSPDLMVEVLQKAVKDSSEVRALLGISGKKPRDQKQNTAAARHFVLVYGDVSHADGFLPVPPDHIVRRGQGAVDAWHEAWQRGKHIPRDEAFDQQDQAALAATAKE